jgi:uncharacterized membrane protein YbhN (UPF0104 family)
MRRRWVQAVLTAMLVGFASWYLWRQWRQASAVPLRVSIDPIRLAAATLIVLATYLLLVEVWRRVLAQYGRAVPLRDAARVWFISNLGKYVPGKVWQVTTMTVMLARLDVPVATAAGASAVITIANVAAGFALLVAVGMPSLRAVAGAHEAAVRVAALVLLVALLAAPFLMRVLSAVASRVLRRPFRLTIPLRAAWLSVAGCALAWLLYGIAFQLFVRSLLGVAGASWLAYVAAYTLSYLVGYLALFAPGGIGARELTLSYLLVALNLTTPAEATVVTVASRVWLTLLEIAPALLFLLSPSDRAARVRRPT